MAGIVIDCVAITRIITGSNARCPGKTRATPCVAGRVEIGVEVAAPNRALFMALKVGNSGFVES